MEAGGSVALIRDHSDSIFEDILLGAKHLCEDAPEDCLYIVLPDKYSGTLLPKLEKFIHQCNLVFEICLKSYTTDLSKIFFAVSHLQDNTQCVWSWWKDKTPQVDMTWDGF